MKKIRCVRDSEDFLELSQSYVNDKEWLMFVRANSGELYLDAHAIRKLRKQLKRALIEIEGEKSEYKPGDSVYLAEGDDEGDDFCKSPSVYDINLSRPVKLIESLGSEEWKLEYETCSGDINTGFAYEKSFGRRA